MRVKTAVPKLRRKRRLLKRVKGFRGGRKRLVATAKDSRIRAEVFATRDRRVKKRTMRRLWILRINAACRQRGTTYGQFINGLARNNVGLDRKVLSDLAIRDTTTFDELVELSKRAG